MSSDAQREIGELLTGQLPPDDVQTPLRSDEIRAWRLCIEAAQEAGGVPLGSFNWPMVLTRLLDELDRSAYREVAAYEQGKEVGRVNGSVRLTIAESERDEARAEIAHVTAERDDALLAAEVATSTPCWRCGGAA